MPAPDKVEAARARLLSPPCHRELFFDHDNFGYLKISACTKHPPMERYWLVQVLFMDTRYFLDYDVAAMPDEWSTDQHFQEIGRLMYMMLSAHVMLSADEYKACGNKLN